MNESELERFLVLTSSFMASIAQEGRLHNRSIGRALEEAVKFGGVIIKVSVSQAAFEYADWVTRGSSKPEWLPENFRAAYVGW
jgi:hypothetical protein